MQTNLLATDVPKAAMAAAGVESDASTKLAIRIEGLSKTYPGGAQPAVNDLSLDVYDGEIVTLLGPSGCGKTTTLRLVAGLETPDKGNIFLATAPLS